MHMLEEGRKKAGGVHKIVLRCNGVGVEQRERIKNYRKQNPEYGGGSPGCGGSQNSLERGGGEEKRKSLRSPVTIRSILRENGLGVVISPLGGSGPHSSKRRTITEIDQPEKKDERETFVGKRE